MSELQAGMLALVIGSMNHPENIGKVVTIRQRAPELSRLLFGDGFEVEGVEPCLFALAKHLLPIRPEADPLDEKQQQELHA